MYNIFYKKKQNRETYYCRKAFGIICSYFHDLFKNYIKQAYNDILGKYGSYNNFYGLLSLFEKFNC